MSARAATIGTPLCSPILTSTCPTAMCSASARARSLASGPCGSTKALSTETRYMAGDAASSLVVTEMTPASVTASPAFRRLSSSVLWSLVARVRAYTLGSPDGVGGVSTRSSSPAISFSRDMSRASWVSRGGRDSPVLSGASPRSAWLKSRPLNGGGTWLSSTLPPSVCACWYIHIARSASGGIWSATLLGTPRLVAVSLARCWWKRTAACASPWKGCAEGRLKLWSPR
ncbi:Uncharacterised protein [Achromobacter ruhlandii]|nr:Uncharacterised protein [Achromobacter ruhlandii]